MNVISEQPVREIAGANPAAARALEDLGIDYCCGGKLSLNAACQRASVPLAAVVEALAVAASRCEQPQPGAPEDAALGDLAKHIVERHHAFVLRESPRIQQLLTKVCDKHGRSHPELLEIQTLFAALSQELAQHMIKEERILFPYIQALDHQALDDQALDKDSSTVPQACFGSVESPISVMIRDHEDAGSILARIRTLANGYAAPAAACPTFRVLYAALQEFERDLHWHVHLENNILFPRAIAAERKRLQRS